MRTIWKFPEAPVLDSPRIDVSKIDKVVVAYRYDLDGGRIQGQVALEYISVRAFRFTVDDYRTAEMFSCYNALCDLGDTEWLSEMRETIKSVYTEEELASIRLMHTLLNTDDGPCIEVICSDVRVQEEPQRKTDL